MEDCTEHDCSRTAPGGYCLRICYCGGCAHYDPALRSTPAAHTAIDRKHILSSTGRRTNLAEYRAAQAAQRRQP